MYVDIKIIYFLVSTKLYLYLHNCTPFNKITLICNYILSHRSIVYTIFILVVVVLFLA